MRPALEGEARTDPLLGQVLAERYRLTRKIGEGGMGTVYEAQHVVLNKPVAVKVLREKHLDRPQAALRLVKEAQLASAIRHDHIVDITDSGSTDDGRAFVVMELVVGTSLAELLKREGALPSSRALAIVQQVASALGAAHERGIVHRDVKPENVLLRSGDFVKVVDFGISKSTKPSDAEEVGRLTSTGVVLGTPFYMSPEQARGEEHVDPLFDVYSLGVILYECLTGEVPFRGPNYLGILQRVVNDQATPPRALRPELSISEAAERVCLKAMAKERPERYQSMEAFAADIERVLTGQPIDAVPPPRPRSRRVTLYAGIAAAVVASGTAAAIAFVVGRRAPAPPVRSRAPASLTSAAAPASTIKKPTRVVLHVESDPSGAEVRDGERSYGRAPANVELTPGSSVHLSFHLDGYQPGFADVKPSADESLRVTLKKKPRAPKPQVPGKPPAAEPVRGETLPNPYGKPK